MFLILGTLSKTAATKSTEIYLDSKGVKFFFHAIAKSEEELAKLLKANWLLTIHKSDGAIRYGCRKNTNKAKNGCEFKGVFVKQNCTLYTRNEHNHPVYAFAGKFV